MEPKLYKNVKLGRGARIGEFVIIGVPPRGAGDGEFKTVIGGKAVIRSHTVIYAGAVIGKGFECGHNVLIREHTRIGDSVSIGTAGVVEHRVKIEDGVRIHSQAFVPEYSILRRKAWIGPCVVLTNAKYPRSRNVKKNLKGPDVGERAKIGANATLLPAVRIGAGALVGAGAVVTKDVPPMKVVAGNPARVIRHLSELSYDS